MPDPETTAPGTTPDNEVEVVLGRVGPSMTDDQIRDAFRRAYFALAEDAATEFAARQDIQSKNLDSFKTLLREVFETEDDQFRPRFEALKEQVVEEVAPQIFPGSDTLPSAYISRQHDPAPTTKNVAQGADPVNLFSGSLAYTVADFHINGAGIDLVFVRSYSQLSAYNGPLGFNWDHSYNLWLRVEDGSRTIHRSTGALREEAFRRHEDHAYWIPPDGASCLLLEEGDSFTVRYPDGTSIFYQPHPTLQPSIHVVARIQDRFGNELRFFYADGLLVRAEANHPGRAIDFRYDSENRIVAIRDFSARVWRYEYDDLGNLSAVTTPGTEQHRAGTVKRYEYAGAFSGDVSLQHSLTAILDADGRLYLENEYGTEPNLLSYRRVVRQRQGNGEILFDYADVIEEFQFPYVDHERPTHQTIVTERDGRQVRYLFNRFGNMIFREEYARLDGVPRLVSSHYRYNRDGNLIGTISPLGVITQALYGRDIYERRFPPGNDSLPETDPNLTPEARLQFDNLLAVVKRGAYHSVQSLNLARGLWSEGIFPDVLQTSEQDVIQVFAYEPEFGQLLTSSDPRFTRSADPAFPEDADYHRHLTRYSYSPGAGFQRLLLESVELPTPTLPDGTPSAPVITRFAEFDANGRIVRIVAPNGVETVHSYSTAPAGAREGFLESMTVDPGGLDVKRGMERDELGRIVKLFRPPFFDGSDDRFFSTVEYDELGQIVKTTGTAPFAISTRYRYNRTGNVVRFETDVKDADHATVGTFATANRYDDEFNLIAQLTGDGEGRSVKQAKVVFDRASRPVLHIAPSGRKTKTSYNERSLVAKTIQDYGGVHATTRGFYDADGRLVRVIDARGSVTRFGYDALGRLVDTEDAQGNRIIRHFDKMDNLLVECQYEKATGDAFVLLSRRELAYDELGRLIVAGVNKFEAPPAVAGDQIHSAFAASGPGELLTVQSFYDNVGNVVKQVDEDGRVFTSEYDLLGRVTKKVDPNGNELRLRYDKEGNLLRADRREVTRDPLTNSVTAERHFALVLAYDELNRPVREKTSVGEVSYKYDSRGKPVEIQDPLGNMVENRYDIFGRLVENRRSLHRHEPGDVPAPVRTLFAYDLDDRQVSQADALGRTTRFQYDSAGRLTSTILPDGSADSSRHDRLGNLIEYRDRNGLVRRLEWDALNRNIALDIGPSGLGSGAEFVGATAYRAEYDGLGRLKTVLNDFAVNRFDYNSLGHLLRDITSFTAATGLNPADQFRIEREFANSGALIGLTYPSGREIRYVRDVLDRAVRIDQVRKGSGYPGDPGLPDPVTLAAIEYEGLQVKRITRHNGISTAFRYDFNGRTVEIRHAQGANNVLTLQFLYDAFGSMRQRIEVSEDHQGTETLRYDSLARLFENRRSSTALLLDLSAISPPGAPLPDALPDHQAQIDQLLSAPAAQETSRYDYDLVGNRISSTLGGLSTYETNELDQYTEVDGGPLRFDGNGNLVEDGTFRYGYDHRNQLAIITRKATGRETRFFFDYLGRRVLQRDGAQSRIFVYDRHNLLEQYDDNRLARSVVSPARLDNVLVSASSGSDFYLLSDLTGSVRYVFDGPAKRSFYIYDEFGNLRQSPTPADDNPFRFAGKRLLGDTGKYEFVFRTYEPAIGRFIQRDPKGFVDGTNLYTFVGNNPLSYSDPLGLARTETNSVPFRPSFMPPPLVTPPNPLPPIPKIDLPQAPPGTNFQAAERAGRANIRNMVPHGPGEQAQHYLKWRIGRQVNLDPRITNDPRYMGPLQSRIALSNGPYVVDGGTYNTPHTYADRGLYPHFDRVDGPKIARWGTDRVVHVNVGRRVQKEMTGSSGPMPPYIVMPTITGSAGHLLYGFTQNFVPFYVEAELAAYFGSHIAWSQGLIGVGNALEFVGARVLPVVGAFTGGLMIGSWINEKTGWSNSLTERALRNEQIYQDIGLGDTSSKVLGAFATLPIFSEVGEGIGRGLGWTVTKAQAAGGAIYERFTSDEYTRNPFESELWSDFVDLF